MDRTVPDPAIEPTVTAARWAAVLGVSTRAVHYAIERGEIPAVRVGRAVRVLTARALTAAGLTPDTNGAGVATPAAATSNRSTISDGHGSGHRAA